MTASLRTLVTIAFCDVIPWALFMALQSAHDVTVRLGAECGSDISPCHPVHDRLR